MCDGCKDLSQPCPSCREFMEAAVSHGLVERMERLEAWVRQHDENERARAALAEYGL